MSTINEIHSNELKKIMFNKDVVVIDVREKEELASGAIKNAKHLPLNSIPDSIDTFDKAKHYVFVCRSGARSHSAAEYLVSKGYQASNMIDGMIKWDGEVTTEL